jgi:hypothetical protein
MLVILVLDGPLLVVGMLVIMIMGMGMNQIPMTVFMVVLDHLDRCRATLAPATFTHIHLRIVVSARYIKTTQS